MATAPAGSLYIDIVTNLAKLQTDMNAMKRAVGGGVDAANASLASATNSTERYASAMEQMAARSGRVGGAFVQTGRSVVVSAGQQRAGMQQLSFQIGDVASSFASGASPMMIFAQQGSQVVQALSLMRGGATGLVGFLAGPWGAVIMGAVTVLGMLATKLFDAGDAATDMTKKQGDLASYVDFTTGKIREQISAVVALAEAQRQGIRAQQAADSWKKSRETLIALGKLDTGSAGFAMGTDLSFVSKQAGKAADEVRRLTDAYEAGAINVNKFGQELKKIGDADPKIRSRIASMIRIGEVVSQSADVNREATGGMRALTGAATEQDKAFLRLRSGTEAHTSAVRAHGAAVATGAGASHAGAVAADRQTAAMAREAAAFDKRIDDLMAETAAQKEVNRLVEEGLIPTSQAEALLRKQAQLRPIVAAMTKAEGKELEDLTAKFMLYAGAIDASNVEKKKTAALAATEGARADIERLETELKLIGATNKERAIALAQLEVQRQYDGGNGMDPQVYADLLELARKRVVAEFDLADAQDAHNAALSRQLDILDALDERAGAVADNLADAFGRPGQAMGELLTELTGYAAKQAALQKEMDQARSTYGAESVEYLRRESEIRTKMATEEIGHIGSVLSAAKGLFKEKSAGYRAVTVLEKVYSALQLANMIKAMVFDKVATASTVANAGIKGTANAAAGAAAIFAQLGPFGFPVVAAMVGVLAAMGLKGLGGGGKGPTIPSAEDIQKAQGTGSVLGSRDAKSDSIANSLELMLKNSNRDLEFSSEMVRSLRVIENGIGSLAGLIARQLGASGGMFDSSGLGLGKNTKLGLSGNFAMGGITGLLTGGIGLGLFEIARKIPVIGGVIDTIAKALFGTTKTVTLLDQGLNFAQQSVDQILNGGFVGSVYQTVQTTRKSKFFGISTGKKTSVSDQTSGLDGGMTDQIGLLIASLRDGIVGAAGTIGIEGAAAMVDAFQLNIGKISLKDLSGEEIEKELQAIFSKAADEMASSAVGGLAAFQKVGEGLFETLMRLARDYQVVDIALQSIGKTFGLVGVASIGARENLIDLFGGLDAFSEATNFFRENFLTEAEQMAPVIAAVQAEMNRLGLATTDTKDEFKQVVMGLDLSTQAGQEMFASLMAVAPAFAKTSDYLAKLNGVVEETGQTAQQLAEIAKQRRALEIQLMDAQGRSEEALAAKRADEIAALDATLRPLQEQVWAAQDAAAAAKALADAEAEAAKQIEQVASQRHGLEIRLMKATGDAAGALAAERADELAALDASNRALLEQVYAAEDAAAANEALNAVTMTAAEIAKTRRELEIQLMEAQGDAAGALRERRADELAALDPVLRALQQEVWAAQDAAAALNALNAVHQTAAELAKSRHDLELRLLDAQGDASGLLAARRADELAATDDSLKSLLQLIYATEDARTAADALAQAQADAARVAEEAAQAAQQAAEEVARAAAELARNRRDLEIRLMEATGDAAGALAARRQDEIAAADESLRALLQQIYAAEDAAVANQALADAQAAAAQAAEEAAQKALELARARSEMEIDLLRALGREAEAVAAERALQLATVDESLKGLQQQVWAAQDAAAAQQALADAQAEAAKAAEDAAAAQQALNEKRGDLEIALLRATGHEIEATAMERARELGALDPTLRALQEQVWAAEDAKAAIDDHNSSLLDQVGKYRDLAAGLRDYRASLAGAAALSAEEAYRAAAAQFGAVFQKARMGDADALGGLQGAGQDFLSAARANASSALDYKRSVGFVAGAVDQAIRVAEGQATDAEKQLAALAQQSDLLTSINGSVMSVHDAIIAAADRGASLALPSSAYVSAPSAADTGEMQALRDEVRSLKDAIVAPIQATAITSKKAADRLESWDNAGTVAVSTRDGDTVETAA